MTTFKVDFYLNETTATDGRPAIFDRFGSEPRTQPGDSLRLVHTADIPADDTTAAREFAFAIGNGAGEPGESEAYYAREVRSLCVGDVVVVHTPDGPGAYACDRYGWTDVDLRDYEIED